MNKEELKSYLTQTFPTATVGESFDFPQMYVTKDELLAVCEKLKDSPETKFDFLFCETAIDWKDRFEVVYHLTSTTYRHDMVLKVTLEDRDNAELPSVYSCWKAAEYFENEIFDLFGINFTDHPFLRRMILGDDWKGYPLRKDYVHINLDDTL